MDVSAIIVNWNTKELLRDCIASIYEQTGSINYEIIVIDNASSDRSCEMVQSEFPEVKLIVEQTNRGYAAAINDAIKIAQGRYALVLNSDIIICDAAIEKTVRFADQHPRAAVVGCQVKESADKIQMTCFQFPSLLNLFLRTSGLAKGFRFNHFFGREDMRWWQRDSERQVDVVSGMFMLVRSEAIHQVGPMDEDFFLYCEETDWCYRFSKAGWKMLFWPGAMILHPGGGGHSSKTKELQLEVQMKKSILLFFKKHYGTIHYILARLMLVFYTGCRCLATVLTVLKKNITRQNVGPDLKEKQKQWAAFKYCAFGLEP